jgi:GTP cyclohydrolase I
MPLGPPLPYNETFERLAREGKIVPSPIPPIETLYNGIVKRQADYVPVTEPFAEVPINESDVQTVLEALTGANFESEHMQNTPKRFMEMMLELCTPKEFEFTTFDNVDSLDEMVSLYRIPFYTLCAHHIIPFHGFAHVGYVPGERIAGLSKFARTVQMFSKGLNIQENMTVDIADFLEAKLRPQGVIVVLEAEHLCMAMRGASTPGVLTRTTAVRGVFASHNRTAKAEFMGGINGASH